MKFQKKNDPNSGEYSSQLQILNEFISFISNLDEKKSVKFKQDAIKVVECLKFIKVNLNFIIYSIKHKQEDHIYTYFTDKSKGLLRDFNNTAMQLITYYYYHLSAESIRDELARFVQQFEGAVQAMQDREALENFAYQLEYHREIGCIEQRTAKALVFATKRLSNPSSYALDDLMEQCGLAQDACHTTALAKANDFLQPYLGQPCIWENNDYILDEVLIKRYLTEIFGFDYENSLDEIPIQGTVFDWRVFKTGTIKERLNLIEQMRYVELNKLILNSQEKCIFYTILKQQPEAVCLALIDKASPSALQQALTQRSKKTDWIKGIEAAIYSESSAVCLALLKKINCIDDIPLRVTEQTDFFFKKHSSWQKLFLALGGARLLATKIKKAINDLKTAMTTISLENILSYHSVEILAEFITKLSLAQRDQLRWPLVSPLMQCRLAQFLLQELQSESADGFYHFLSSHQPIRDYLVSDNSILLTNCINLYFEGKGEVPQKLKSLFIECLNEKKIPLSQKEKTFLEILTAKTPVITASLESNAHKLWQQGIHSWQHYRYYRLQQDNRQLQEIIDRLVSADLLFKGSPACFSDFFSSNHALSVNIDDITAQQALDCIQQSKGLVKIIKPQHWKFFLDQLENLNKRPLGLRKIVREPTHKFIHLTGNIVTHKDHAYDAQVIKPRKNYTHTKKTSTTLLSSKMSTSVFGEHHPETHWLVGILFDQTQCQVKAMLLKDSGTVLHSWLGDQSAVTRYKDQMAKINQTNWDIFAQEVNNRFRHNEVLAKVNKTAMRAIFIAQDTPETRRMALQRRDEIEQKFSIRLPIIFYSSSLQTTRHYTLSEQEDDLRTWNEKQKVCTPREPVSKENVLSIYYACINKTDWQLGVFGNSARVQNKSVPRTVALCEQIVNKASQAEQAESSSYTWVEAEKNIKDALTKKTIQNKFFQLYHGRSNNTVEFYKALLKKHF